ncbi:PIPO, partial [Daphne mosaic virus]|uniref:PIPO n=1 Tax=Daphne mosaic virus TaxID=578107 RepID=UPI00026514CA
KLSKRIEGLLQRIKLVGKIASGLAVCKIFKLIRKIHNDGRCERFERNSRALMYIWFEKGADSRRSSGYTMS